MNEANKEANEAHNSETNSSSGGDLKKLCVEKQIILEEQNRI